MKKGLSVLNLLVFFLFLLILQTPAQNTAKTIPRKTELRYRLIKIGNFHLKTLMEQKLIELMIQNGRALIFRIPGMPKTLSMILPATVRV